MYGEKALKDRQCQNWFNKFRFGDFSLKNEERSSRPNEVNDDQIEAIIESDRHVSVREIKEMLEISKSTINRYIQCLGLVKKLDIWIPRELKEIHLTKRINVCDLYLKCNEFDPFLKGVITDVKKLMVQNKVFRKRSWSKRDEPPQTTSKAESNQKEIMLSVWYMEKLFISIVTIVLFNLGKNVSL